MVDVIGWLLIPIGIACLCGMLYIQQIQKERNEMRAKERSDHETFLFQAGVIEKGQQDYTDLLANIRAEADRLGDEIDQLKLEIDSDEFPATKEQIINQSNLISNYRLLQRLFKDEL